MVVLWDGSFPGRAPTDHKNKSPNKVKPLFLWKWRPNSNIWISSFHLLYTYIQHLSSKMLPGRRRVIFIYEVSKINRNWVQLLRSKLVANCLSARIQGQAFRTLAVTWFIYWLVLTWQAFTYKACYYMSNIPSDLCWPIFCQYLL